MERGVRPEKTWNPRPFSALLHASSPVASAHRRKPCTAPVDIRKHSTLLRERTTPFAAHSSPCTGTIYALRSGEFSTRLRPPYEDEEESLLIFSNKNDPTESGSQLDLA